MNRIIGMWRNQKGMTLVFVAGLMVTFITFAALSVDIAHLYVVHNELQNAADAGALAGARRLYLPDGSAINIDANRIAYEAAIANNSERLPVEVRLPYTNQADVQRGHYSFATQTFTPSESTAIPDLWGATTTELDADTTFINALKVRTRRQQTPAASFFARIMGFRGFNISAEATAYIGYAGAVSALTIDQPIAVCRQSIMNGDSEFSCSTGRMMNANVDAAAWTNFTQPCQTASASSVRPLICEEGANEKPMVINRPMGTINGQLNSAYKDLRGCWDGNSSLDSDKDGVPDQSWQLTLPVVDCCPPDEPNCDPAIGNCMEFVGIVDAEILWISEWGNGKVTTPRKMDDWACSKKTKDKQCWKSFVKHFNIQNYDGSYPDLEKKSIYMKPTCTPHLPVGVTGGQNFGVLAKIPVLVN
jgi:Flp pilus assembly protein TadG